MARLSYVDPDRAAAKVRSTYEGMEASRGRVPNLLKILAHYPKGMQATLSLQGALRDGILDPKLRELAYLAVSRVNGCGY